MDANLRSTESAPSHEFSTAPQPVHLVVYQQLREAVLFGDLAPGQAVTFQGLVSRFSASMTPVREAIRRLIAEGALEFQGNRRVTVPTLSMDNIEELLIARKAIETALAERAVARITTEDIDRLEAIDTAVDAAIASGDVRAYLRQNHAFHDTLHGLAQSPILYDVANGLWLRFGPSLRVVCGRLGTQSLPDRHREAIAALRAGDHKAAVDAMCEDVVQGMEQIRVAFAEEADSSMD